MLAAEAANFAFDLIRETGLSESTIISPLSISIALDMVLLGAKNNTAHEIQNVIAKESDVNDIHKHFSKIYCFIKEKIEFENVNIANKVYYSDDLKILETYKNQIQKYFDGNFDLVDFTKNHETANEINKFVADSTDNEIKDFMNSKIIKEDTKIILVNVLRFEKTWQDIFSTLKEKSMFYSASNITNEVSMMYLDETFRYHSNEKFQFLEIPYECENFCMYILLPNEKFGLQQILKNLEIKEIFNSMSNAISKAGYVAIPKFEYESNFNLKNVLKHLGIKDAFYEELADFSGISDNKDICISDVIHKAVIQVDEYGTKASAGTGGSFLTLGFNSVEEFKFVADHPFLYFIADEEKNIYFIGTFFN